MLLRSIASQLWNVNIETTQICAASTNGANLEINDVLENILLLLNYIKKRKTSLKGSDARRGNTTLRGVSGIRRLKGVGTRNNAGEAFRKFYQDNWPPT